MDWSEPSFTPLNFPPRSISQFKSFSAQSPSHQQQGQQQTNLQSQAAAGANPQAGANGNPEAPRNTAPQSNVPQQQKELNLLTLCRIGQETVQEILTRFQEIFNHLKQVQPPNGKRVLVLIMSLNIKVLVFLGTPQGTNISLDRKLKVQEQFRTIRLLFKRLRLLYDKCNDTGLQGGDHTNIESFIPYRDEMENKPEPFFNDEYKKALQENRELTETVNQKNRILKEVIDKLRITIWEINTMLAMRQHAKVWIKIWSLQFKRGFFHFLHNKY